MNRLKKLLIWVAAGFALYFVLGHHFILIGNSVKVLKKSELTLNYTLFSAKGKKIESIIAIPELRRDGIGQLLVDEGQLSRDKLDILMERYED
jgi:hypothetical protein